MSNVDMNEIYRSVIYNALRNVYGWRTSKASRYAYSQKARTFGGVHEATQAGLDRAADIDAVPAINPASRYRALYREVFGRESA